jgi:homoserine O-succinyltransferase/O-acetyltransferase
VKFLNGERLNYPGMPENYFDDETVSALAAFRRRAEWERNIRLLASLPLAAAEARLPERWRSAAISIYKSWFDYLAERKGLGSKAVALPFRPGRRDGRSESLLHSSC